MLFGLFIWFKVTFAVPNLSTESKDWLAYCSTTSSSVSTKPRFSFPVLSTSNRDWLSEPKDVSVDSVSPMSTESSGSWQMTKMDTDASIQRWLRDIKQNPVDDEEDFEVISKKDFLGILYCWFKHINFCSLCQLNILAGIYFHGFKNS